MNRDEEILLAFAMEENVTPSVLRKYVIDNPSLTQDLLLLYDELTLEDIEEQHTIEVEEAEVDEMILKRVNRAQQALYGEELPTTAKNLSLPRRFLNGINSSFVRIGTIPANFISNLAAEIDVYTQDVLLAMFQPRKEPQYRAVKKPDLREAKDFWTYVNNSELTEKELETVKLMAKK